LLAVSEDYPHFLNRAVYLRTSSPVKVTSMGR
jgi:hypothetical protein